MFGKVEKMYKKEQKIFKEFITIGSYMAIRQIEITTASLFI